MMKIFYCTKKRGMTSTESDTTIAWKDERLNDYHFYSKNIKDKSLDIDYDENGMPILKKFTLNESGNRYFIYKNIKDENGALLPDLEKIEEEKIKLEKLEKEMRENRKLTLINKLSSPSFELKTFGSIETYLCPTCRNYTSRDLGLGISNDYFVDMFYFGNNTPCERCNLNSIPNIQIDYLEKLNEVIFEDNFNNIYLSLGAKEVHGVFNMKAKQINDIHLSDLDIPKTARILDMNLTSNCHLTLLTFIPNNTRFTNTIIHENILSFYTDNLIDDNVHQSDENRLSVNIKWIDIDKNNLIDINLLNAIDNYIKDNPLELIMNANRTLELICKQICYKEFTNNFDSYSSLNRDKRKAIEKIKNKKYIPFSYILDNFINEICQIKNINNIDNYILDKIKIYMNFRNDIAHQGKLENDKELTKNEKIEILAVTLLGASLMKNIYNKL